MAEIQQSSDVTYRLYDYGRPGADGSPRELHIERALEVCRHEATEGKSGVLPLKNNYFEVELLNIRSDIPMSADERFHGLLCVEGRCNILHSGLSYPVKMGDMYFVPWGTSGYTLTGEADLLLITAP